MLALSLVVLLAAAPPRSCQSLAEGSPQDEPDAAAARRCFEAEKDWLALAVLSATGDGGDDVEPLLARFTASKAALPEWVPLEEGEENGVERVLAGIRGLAKEPASQRRPGRGFERLCRKLARTTLGSDLCNGESARLDEAFAARQVRAWVASLTPAQRGRFDALATAFEALRKADGARAYQRYAEGTIRNAAALEQERLLRDGHLERLGRVIARRALPAADAKAFSSADAALNRAYKALPKEERNEAREAQRKWLVYREAFEALARSLAGPDAGAVDVLPLRTLLTRWRTYELERDPVMGEGGAAPE